MHYIQQYMPEVNGSSVWQISKKYLAGVIYGQKSYMCQLCSLKPFSHKFTTAMSISAQLYASIQNLKHSYQMLSSVAAGSKGKQQYNIVRGPEKKLRVAPDQTQTLLSLHAAIAFLHMLRLRRGAKLYIPSIIFCGICNVLQIFGLF